MSLIDDIRNDKSPLGQDLLSINTRATQRLQPKVIRTQGLATELPDNPLQQQLAAERTAINSSLEATQEVLNEGGLGGYANRSSYNPLVKYPAEAWNLGAKAAGSLINFGENLLATDSMSDASFKEKMLAPYRDLYIRSDNRNKVEAANSELAQLNDIIASSGMNALVGHDRRFKTYSEYQDKVAKLREQTNLAVTTDEEEQRLDTPNENMNMLQVMRGKGSTTPRQHFQDLANEKDAIEKFVGNKEKNIASFTGANMVGSKQREAHNQEKLAIANRDVNPDEFGATAKYAYNALTNMGVGYGAEVLSEMAPMLAGRTASFAIAGDANRVFNKGMLDSRDKDTGLNSAGDELRAGGAAAAYTALNFAERALMVNSAAGRVPITDAIARGAGDVTEKTLGVLGRGATAPLPTAAGEAIRAAGSLIPTNLAGRAVATVGATGAAEGVIEGMQEYVEGVASGEWKYDPEKVGTAAGIGFGLGGALGSVGVVPSHLAERSVRKTQEHIQETYGDAEVATADMLNPMGSSYSPQQGLNRVFDYSFDNANTEFTPETGREQVVQYMDDLNDVVSSFEQRKQLVEMGEAGLQSLVDRLSKVIGSMPEGDPSAQKFVDGLEMYSSILEAVKSDPDHLAKIDREIAATKEDIAHAQTTLDDFDSKMNTKDGKAKYKTEEPTEDNFTGPVDNRTWTQKSAGFGNDVHPDAEVRKFFNAPRFEDVEAMERVAEAADTPEPVRNALRVIAQALRDEDSAKTTEKVSRDVTAGSARYRGTADYIKDMSVAVANDDVGKQKSLMRQIESFHSSRVSKLNTIEQAVQIAMETGKMQQVIKPASSDWTITDKRIPPHQKKANAAIDVHAGEGKMDKLIEGIGNDIAKIESAMQAMQTIQMLRESAEQPPVETPVGSLEQALSEYEANVPMANQNPVQGQPEPFSNPIENSEASAVDNTTPFEQATFDEPAYMQQEFEQGANVPSDQPQPQGGFNEQIIQDGNSIPQADTDLSVQDTIQSSVSETKAKNTATKTEPKQANVSAPSKSASTPSTPDAPKSSGNKEQKVSVKRKKVDVKKTFSNAKDAETYLNESGNGTSYRAVESKDGTVALVNTKVSKAKEKDSKHAVENDAAPTQQIETAEREAQDNAVDSAKESTETADIDPTPVSNSSIDDTVEVADADVVTATNIASLNRTKDEVTAEKKLNISEQNLFTTGFGQKLKKGLNSLLTVVGYDSNKVSPTNPNQISKLINSFTGIEPNDAQVAQLQDYYHFMQDLQVKSIIENSMKPVSNMKYAYKQFANFFMQDGKVDPVIADAIGAGIYSWLAENGNYTVTDKSTLAKILRTDSKSTISPAAWNLLGKVGYPMDTMAMSLGQRILQSLQLRSYSDVDITRQSVLEQTLGNMAVGVMVQGVTSNKSNVPLVDITPINASELISLSEDQAKASGKKGDVKSYTGKEVIYFVRPTFNNEVPKRIADTSKGTFGIMSDLFGFTPAAKQVSLEPIKAVQQRYGAFNRKIPKGAQDALKALQSTPYRLETSNVNIARNIFTNGTKAQVDMFMGAMGHVDPNTRHVAFRESIESANDGIVRALNRVFDAQDQTNGADMYLPVAMWNNMRIGVTSEFNPQGDKIHRGFSSLTNDKVTVPVTRDLFGKGNQLSDYGKFLRAIGFRIEDVKINGMAVDKAELKDFIPAMDEYVHSDKVRNAAMALNKMTLSNEYLDSDVKVVTDLLKEWGMGSLGLSALNAIKDMHVAKLNGDSTFDSYVPADSDGLVNGVAFTSVLMMHSGPDYLESLGFLGENPDNQVTNMQKWRSLLGRVDPYERLGLAQRAAWDNTLNSPDKAIREAAAFLDRIDPDFGQRKGAKRAMTPFNYGAELDSINRAQSREFLNKVYEAIEQSPNNPELLRDLNSALRLYYAHSGKTAVYLDMAHMQKESMIPEKVEQAIRGLDEMLHGEATAQAIDNALGQYKDKRDQYSNMVQVSFGAFEGVYKVALQKALDKKIEQNPDQVLRAGNGQIIEGLTKQERDAVLESVMKYMPNAATVHSIEENSLTESGSPYAEWSNVAVEGLQNEVIFSSNFSERMIGRKTKGDNTNFKFNVYDRELSSRGLGVIASYIQAMDAYVAMEVAKRMKVQNYHDATSGNAFELDSVAKLQNEVFLDAVTKSHMGMSFSQGLLRALQGVAAYNNDLDIKTKQQATRGILDAAKQLGIDTSKGTLSDALRAVIKTRVGDDIKKLDFLQSQYAIAQYATENGEFLITDEKRAEIEDQKTKLLESQIPNLMRQVDKLATTLDSIPHSKVQSGKETFSRGLMNMDSNVTLKELVGFARNHISAVATSGNAKRNSDAMNALLDAALVAAEKANTKVTIIKPDTDTAKIHGYAQAVSSGAPAFYSSVGNRNAVNIIASEVKSPETIIHEIVHAATAQAVDASKSKEASPQLKEAVNRLDGLRQQVEKTLTPESPSILHYAVQNVDEFLATGLTNRVVIDYMDSQISTELNGRSTKSLGTVFRDFIRNTLNALYAFIGKGRKLDTATLTGYEAIVIDAATVMSENSYNFATNKVHKAPREKAIDEARDYSPSQVFNTLSSGNNSTAHTNKLSSFITGTVEPMYDKLSKYMVSGDKYSPDQLWNEALKSGQAPYTTDAMKAGYVLSAQEQMAVEAIETVSAYALKDTALKAQYDVIDRAYTSAKENTKVADFHAGDWRTATQAEKDIATSKYNYLFGDKGADLISRFAAMSIASEEVSSIMDKGISAKTLISSEGNNKFEKLVNLVNGLFSRVDNQNTKGASRLPVNEAVPASLAQLVQLQLKGRNKAVESLEHKYSDVVDRLDEGTVKLRESIAKTLGTDKVSKTGNRYVDTVMNSVGIASKTGNAVNVLNPFNDFRDSLYPNQRLGMLGELGTEIAVQGNSQKVAAKFMAEAKRNEAAVERIRSVTRKDLKGMFSSPIDGKTSKQITDVLLRTDIQSLLADYDINGVMGLVKDDAKLSAEIAKMEKTVTALQRNRSRDLAKYMTGHGGSNTLAKNALMIASDVGYTTGGINADPQAVKNVDVLVSLYALQRTSNVDRKAIAELFNKEKGNKEGNGVEKVLRYHNNLADISLNGLFAGTPSLYTKGFLPTITNPNKQVVVARTAADIKMYRDAMYKEIGPINTDGLDTNKSQAIMFSTEDAVHQRLISGAVAFQNGARKGTEVEMNRKQIGDATAKVQAKYDLSDTYNPDEIKGAQAIPSYDLDGFITGYNYEITAQTMDTLLERDNSFENLLAEHYAQLESKARNQDQNLNVMDAIIDNAARERNAHNKDQWIFVGQASTDQAVLDTWRMIPKYARDHVYERTGNNGFYVNVRAYNTLFGVRKLAAVTAFDKSFDERNFKDKLITSVMRVLFRDNARIATARSEGIWQEAVRTMKDIVVIRNGVTAMLNIVSNAMLLLTHGIPPTDIIRHSTEAVKAGGEYRKNANLLIQLQNKQRAGDLSSATENEIMRVQQRIDKNPLIDLINAGMFSGIVEDIDNKPQEYTYKSALAKKTAKFTDVVPTGVKRAAEHVMVSPNTPLYQFLYSATQYGDFAAKYAIYKHYTEKAKDKLSKEDAMQMANDNFVNYDIPTSAGMQYANDMGLLMFTKYNLRIQRALFGVLAKRPATAIAQAMMVNAMNLATVRNGLDPIVFNNIGMPFRSGAFGLIGALDEPLPIKLMKEVF